MEKRLLTLGASLLLLSACGFGTPDIVQPSDNQGDNPSTVQDPSDKNPPAAIQPIILRANPSESHIAIAGKKGSIILNQGKFNTIDFQMFLNPERPKAFEIQQIGVGILIGSMVTDNVGLTMNLLSRDYLNSERFPLASFVSTSIENTGGTLYRITGELTLRDVTRSISFDAEITNKELSMNTMINTNDFGLRQMEDYDPDVPVQAKIVFAQ